MVRLLAYYLPQYHPIAENDAWWGKGFTEWDNVQSALPLFEGHEQPQIPHESIGYYDLRDAAFLERQHRMARRYGLNGFCYYFYFFNGKTLLETPLQMIRSMPQIDTEYCLCWANSPWTRAWYGQNKEILLCNDYSAEQALQFIECVGRYFSDPRYICVDNKPMLLVYDVEDITNIERTVDIWQTWAKQNGYDGVYLVNVEAMLLGVAPEQYGFDAAVEFAPDWTQTCLLPKRGNSHRLFDYKGTVLNMLQKPTPNYIRFPGAFPGWDNTPRYKGKSIAFVNNSPGAFAFMLEHAMKRAASLPEGRQFVFINAWNEWGEGCHLEPDSVHGFSYLQVIKSLTSG